MIWSDLYQEILPHVAGCPEPLIDDALRRTVTKFCRETHIWKEQLDDIYPVSGVTRYQLALPEETQLLELSDARYNTGNGKTSQVPMNEWPTVNVFGLLTFSEDPGNKPIQIHGILIPSKDATGVPDRIGEHYRESLIHGAIAMLQEIPKRDWSAPEYASFHKAEFNSGIFEAKRRKARGNTERPMRVAPRALL